MNSIYDLSSPIIINNYTIRFLRVEVVYTELQRQTIHREDGAYCVTRPKRRKELNNVIRSNLEDYKVSSVYVISRSRVRIPGNLETLKALLARPVMRGDLGVQIISNCPK